MRENFTGTILGRLDPRQMLSADFPSISSTGTLSFVGNSQGNVIEISSQPPTRKVFAVDGRQYVFGSRVKRIFVSGQGGNDRLDGGSGRDGMFGGSGMDVFEALDGEIHFLDGGPDEDAMNLNGEDMFVNI